MANQHHAAPQRDGLTYRCFIPTSLSCTGCGVASMQPQDRSLLRALSFRSGFVNLTAGADLLR